MNASRFTLSRSATRSAGFALALCLTGAGLSAAPKETDAFPTFESFIKISGRAPSVTGDPAAFAERFHAPENGSYGIEALHLSRDLDKATNLVIDGKALLGSEDYLGKFRLTKSDVGSVEVGYKRFRTFYDGIGGFFPLNQAWHPLGTEELHTDRANFWADVNIALPNRPVFHLRYTNELRDGRKDSTIWGDSDITGIPIYNVSSLNPVSADKKIIPSLLVLNERQQNLAATVTHTVGKTELEVEVAKNWTDSTDTRWMNRYPGELKLFPLVRTTPPAFLIPGTQANNFTTGFDTQFNKADIWSYVGKFTTKVSDKLTVYGGLSYQDASADIAGNRQMTLVIATNAGVVKAVGGFVGAGGRPPYSYQTLSGTTSEQIVTGNLGLTYKPKADLTIGLAVKTEKLDMDGSNLVNYTSNSINQTTGVVVPVNVLAPNTSKRSEKPWTPELDVRYTGIKNVSLYGTVDYRYAPGDEVGSSAALGTGGNAAAPVVSFDNVRENHGHYKVGFNWNATTALTLRAETFYKDHKNNYTGYGSSLGGRYILGYQFNGYKLTAIMKATPTLSFTSRYVGQMGRMDTTVDTQESYQSMDSKSHNFGETIDWNPNKQVYAQANVNVVFATISTAYPRAGGAANDILRNADNNYWNGNVLVGFVLNKVTDVQLDYTAYHADNYDPLAPPASVSFGAGAKEYTVTAGVKYKLSDKIILNGKLGYFDSKSETTGGNTNFRGPMAYVSLDYAL